MRKFLIVFVLFTCMLPVYADQIFVSGKQVCSNAYINLAIQIYDAPNGPVVKQEPINFDFLYGSDTTLRYSYFINKYCDQTKPISSFPSYGAQLSSTQSIVCCSYK